MRSVKNNSSHRAIFAGVLGVSGGLGVVCFSALWIVVQSRAAEGPPRAVESGCTPAGAGDGYGSISDTRALGESEDDEEQQSLLSSYNHTVRASAIRILSPMHGGGVSIRKNTSYSKCPRSPPSSGFEFMSPGRRHGLITQTQTHYCAICIVQSIVESSDLSEGAEAAAGSAST